MNLKTSAIIVGLCLSQPASAQSFDIPNPESVAVDSGGTLVLSTGVDSDFGNAARDGAIYRVDPDGVVTPIELSEAVGLQNPTSILTLDDRWIIADGSAVVAVDLAGQLLWRSTAAHQDAFLYDLALMDDDVVLLSDFGTGRLFAIDPKSGGITEFDFDKTIPGLARLAVRNGQIFLTTWGSDEAFDGRLQVLKNVDNTWVLKHIAGGFGNPEGVSVLDDASLVVGTWRGREDKPNTRVFHVTPDGVVSPIAAFDGAQGPADLVIADGTLIVPMLGSNSLVMQPTGSLR